MVLCSGEVNKNLRKVLAKSAQSVPKRNDPESNPDNIQSEAECLKES